MEEAALFRGVFDAVPDAVVVVDSAGSIVLANSQCREVFGREAGALVGESIEVLVPERFRTGHPRRRDGYRADPNPRPMGLLRLAARRADGSEFPAEISLAPIVVDGASYVSATVRDITGRIREEERFRNLLEAAPDPTIIVDDTATIVLANDQMQNVFGYERADLVGRSVTVLASTPGPDVVLGRIQRYLLDPDLVPMGYTQEFRIRHCRGHDVPVEIGVAFAPKALDSAHILSLAVGDVVPLEHRVGTPLRVQIGGVHIADAVAGKAGTRLAALVVDEGAPVHSAAPKELA